MDEARRLWRIAADTGGTFTDVIGWADDGTVARVKVLSSGALRLKVKAAYGNCLRLDGRRSLPDGFFAGYRIRRVNTNACDHAVVDFRDLSQELILRGGPGHVAQAGDSVELTADEEAPVLGARLLTGTPAGTDLPVEEFRLATTRGTNALLEEKGARVVFFVSAGFGDLLRIGDQKRPDLFALDPARPGPLPAVVVEVDERLDAAGAVLRPLDPGALEPRLRELRAAGFTVAAVALAHSYRNPAHERTLEEALRRAGFTYVAGSAALAPFIKIVPRAETAVIDAYLGPLLREYLGRVAVAFEGEGTPARPRRLRIMTSAGGLAASDQFRAKDSLLSGPAGGVTGAAAVGHRAGEERLISFDMGGTSTDVARVAGEPAVSDRHTVGRATLLAPALRIETVAAGGGSVCSVREGALAVGPESAGASPGPACYGAGGPFALTDVNLLLGRLREKGFGVPVDRGGASAAFQHLRAEVGGEGSGVPDDETLLEGFLKIANQRMADAIRVISVREGYDPADHTLLAFGGAGGQHACAVARRLGMRRILSPADAGLLSACGLHCARVERVVERQVLEPLDAASARLGDWFAAMEASARRDLEAEGFPEAAVEIGRREVFLRFAGQESAHAVALGEDAARLREDFTARYRQLFGYVPGGRPLEVVRLRLRAAAGARDKEREHFQGDASLPFSGDAQPCFVGGEWQQVPVFERAALPAGAVLKAPALVVDPYSTLLIEPGWQGLAGDRGSIRLERAGTEEDAPAPSDAEVAVVARELFANRLTRIVEEMGEQLRRTALSTNIKERLDFSCGLLDAEGRLITNAPHIPVHLGALGLCVRAVASRLKLEPGDVVLTNHPGFGGSHLPDLTVITPVFADAGELLGYVANRAHHAELGGVSPGSMPPEARSLAEEGVVIPPLLCLRAGESRLHEVEARLRAGPWPSRAVKDNLADLDAQLAANRLGATALSQVAAEIGVGAVRDHMQDLYARAARAIETRLEPFRGRTLGAEERLDDGSLLKVALTFGPEAVRVDFTGTCGRHPANLNATPAIVRSALIYVLRLLVADRIPLNDGLLDAVELVLPGDSLLNPHFPEDPVKCPPVVGGNVEVSQRLVDLLLKPFGVAACSQGTMNNLVFGGPDCPSYYETICGGAGAGPDFDGASGVHSHMTNTAITDPEILEHRYPVRLERFALREGSGGPGQCRGGDGVVRELLFLQPVTVSLLTQHRVEAPYGLNGGGHGARGRQRLESASGETRELPGWTTFEAAAGDRLVVETPGGGGFGIQPEGEIRP